MIRLAEFDDLKKIYEIEVEVYSNPWTFESFLYEFNNDFSNIYVFEENGDVAGFIVVWDFENEVEIANVAVKKNFWGRGIGKKLLKYVLDRDKSFTAYLEVEDGNFRAIKLYESLGFEKYGFRKNYYGKGKDAILMKFNKG